LKKPNPRIGEPIDLSSLRQNAILNALADSSIATVLERGTLESLKLRQPIYDSEQQIHDVHFPIDCVLSIVARMRDGTEIEVGTIGREGMSALPLLLGASSTANVCYCQVRGCSIKISADLFRELATTDRAFQQLLDRYLQAYVNMLSQLAACNRLHTVYQRCSRWLLMSHDRVGSDAIPLTQEFLGTMLGTSRSGIAIAATRLQQAGLIRWAHRIVYIVDRVGLESASCECYEVARRQFHGSLRPRMGTRESA
jgi:CRP-like cAMP-binding protein